MRRLSNLSETSKALLTVLREKNFSAVRDWTDLFELSGRTGFVTYVYHLIKRSGKIDIPKEILGQFKNNYLYCLNKTEMHKTILKRLLKGFQEQDIPVMPVKGIVQGELLYGSSELRSLPCDIDFLVQARYKNEANAYLENAGYRSCSEVPWSTVYSKKGSPTIDMHWEYCPEAEVDIHTEAAWARNVDYDFGGMNIKILSPEDMVIYLAMVTNNDCCRHLRHFFDLHRCIEKYKAYLDWDYITQSINAVKMQGVFFLPFLYCDILFGTAIDEKAGKKIRVHPLKRFILCRLLNPKWPVEMIKPEKRIKPWIEGGIISGASPLRFVKWIIYRINYEYIIATKGEKRSIPHYVLYMAFRLWKCFMPARARVKKNRYEKPIITYRRKK